jgi:hypothetical protein
MLAEVAAGAAEEAEAEAEEDEVEAGRGEVPMSGEATPAAKAVEAEGAEVLLPRLASHLCSLHHPSF